MQKLIEFYEMACLNSDALDDGEKAALMDARRGLRLFARAMERFKSGSPEPASMAEVGLRLAA